MSVQKRGKLLSTCGLLIILLFLLSSCGNSEKKNPLFYLSEKDALDISIDDIQLLLDTPVKELDDFFEITANDKTEWMMGITSYPTSTFIDEGSTEMRHIDGVLFVEPFPATYHSLPAEDSTDIVERLVAGDFSEVRLTNGTLIDEYTKELLEKLIAMMDGETCEHE